MLLLFEEDVGDLMTGLLVSDDDELSGLTVASRRSPARAIENPSNHLFGNIFCPVVSSDAPSVLGEFVKLVDAQHVILH
jgi:hypothetical protein